MTSLGAALVASVVIVSSAGAADFVSNGSFNAPSGGSVHTTYFADGDFGGWVVTDGSVDLVGGEWQAPKPGEGSVDLDGYDAGTISQALSLTPGRRYRLDFSLSGNPGGGDGVKIVKVTVGDLAQSFAFRTRYNSASDMRWAAFSLGFTAGPTNTLTFASQSAPRSVFGPVIGAVSIAAVPEPASWAMMIAGFGMVGGALRGRRRSAVA